jgi:type I restriction enzyme S subunit
MMRLVPDGARADSKFVWYWLQCPIVRVFIISRAKGTSASMKKISQKVVMDIPVPATLVVQEQRRIVAELDALQAEVDELKRLQDKTAGELNALLPAILDRAFKGEL